MKTKNILGLVLAGLIVFLALGVSVPALQTSTGNVVLGIWYDNDSSATSMTIREGQSVDFNVYTLAVQSAMTVDVDLVDSSNNILEIASISRSYQDFNEFGIDEEGDYTLTNDDYSAGNYKIRLTVHGNAGSTGILELDLTVLANNAPAITAIPNQQIDENSTYVYQVVATDADNDALTYSLTQKPTGMEISDAGLISWETPSVDADTDYNINVQVSDNVDSTTESFVLTVIDAFDTLAPSVDITYPLAGNAVGGSEIITFIDSETTNPECSVDNVNWIPCTSGVTTLSLIPEFATLADGAFILYLRDTDAAGNVGTDSEAGIIKDSTISDTIAPVITITSPVDGETYDELTLDLIVTANEAVSSWSYSLNGAANITFTPNVEITFAEGSNTITVYAEDLAGNVGSASVTFDIELEVEEEDTTKEHYSYSDVDETDYTGQETSGVAPTIDLTTQGTPTTRQPNIFVQAIAAIISAIVNFFKRIFGF
ncbi:MAG: putative Ig domain-containing protein [archaeon]